MWISLKLMILNLNVSLNLDFFKKKMYVTNNIKTVSELNYKRITSVLNSEFNNRYFNERVSGIIINLIHLNYKSTMSLRI